MEVGLAVLVVVEGVVGRLVNRQQKAGYTL
jgi:hypothetical protein